jgi:hypothetical protein
MNTQAIKPGSKRIATSTGKPDQRQRDNKKTPSNKPSLKPSKSRIKIDSNPSPIVKNYIVLML